MAATGNEKLYVSQGGGGKSTVSASEVAALANGSIQAPTASIRGGVLLGDAVANCTVAADGTSAGTQLNLLLAELRASGVIAAA
jgi:hypothetical protein